MLSWRRRKAPRRPTSCCRRCKPRRKFNDFARGNTDGNEKGGDLGTFKSEAMTKPFADAAFKLEVNQVSAVVDRVRLPRHQAHQVT